jgi:LacI family transcriptional regulator
VFCHDDFEAMRVNDACIIRKVTTPDEIAVLGVGNTVSICEHECIPLSSIRIDYRRIGCEAAKLLGCLMNGKKTAEEVLIPPSGIAERQSTDALGADDPTVKKALDHIHQHLSEPAGAAQVAAAIGIPRQKLDRLFAKELARPVGKEILRQRISAVKTLLTGSDDDLAEIAGKTGFCNPSYLILVFQRETGMTPRDWRFRHVEAT